MKKIRLAGGLLAIGTCLLLQQPALANDVAEVIDPIEKLANILHVFVGFLSWAWVIFAALAGKLMTNDFVFGGFFHMDVYLFKMANITKNIANFGLAFVFVFFILQTIWKEGGDMSNIAKKVLGFIFAGVLINASTFITQILVDVSTIGVSAAGGMAESFVGMSDSLKEQISNQSAKRVSVIYTKKGGIDVKPAESNRSFEVEEILDTILPKSESIAGPLVYLGANVLNIQKYSLLKDNLGKDKGVGYVKTILQGKNLALGFLIQLCIVGSFTLALFALVIANIIRIGMIWIMIALGPILFLLWGLSWAKIKLPGDFDINSAESGLFSFGGLSQLIFLPVFTTLMMSLIMIFSTTLRSTMSSNNTIQDNTTKGNTVSVNEVIDLTYEGNFLGDNAKDIFADFIVTIITILLIWFMAKHSIPKKTPIAGGISDSIFKLGAKAASSVGFIPLPGGGTTGVGGLMSLKDKNNPITSMGRQINKIQNNQNTRIQETVNGRLGQEVFALNNQDIETINTKVNSAIKTEKITTFFNTIKSQANSKSSKKIAVEGKMLFSDSILKKLQEGIIADKQLNTLPRGVKGSDPKDFYKPALIKKLLEKLQEAGFDLPINRKIENIKEVADLQNMRFTYNKS